MLGKGFPNVRDRLSSGILHCKAGDADAKLEVQGGDGSLDVCSSILGTRIAQYMHAHSMLYKRRKKLMWKALSVTL
jgi:hypothetical protein